MAKKDGKRFIAVNTAKAMPAETID